MSKNKVRLTFYIDPDDLDALQQVKVNTGVTVAEQARRIIGEHLRRRREERDSGGKLPAKERESE